ncbi:MAG: helix-turn-helix protein [Gammaproteobacteria bacterium]|nr:helix-turn-helix protein [Gammaproteobacteria bacterium]
MNTISALNISKSQAKALATNLRLILDARHLSESDLAHALNLPIMTIRRLVSGETADPRISTLKTIADYLNISLDSLTNNNESNPINLMNKSMPQFVPVLDWETAATTASIKEINLKTWEKWHPIATVDQPLSKNAFALPSRPSMQPRFPHGSLFIIEPNEAPHDRDIVLVKISKNSSLSLRELVIDSPKWQLQPIVPGSALLFYEETEHVIVGVVILTLFNSRRGNP